MDDALPKSTEQVDGEIVAELLVRGAGRHGVVVADDDPHHQAEVLRIGKREGYGFAFLVAWQELLRAEKKPERAIDGETVGGAEKLDGECVVGHLIGVVMW